MVNRFIDARSLPDHSLFEADLAIIGGGAAGITLARAFIGSRVRVCLIESGGAEFDPQVQALYEGENTGIDYPLAGNRLRFLGGSSNHWGGYCRTLDRIDFEKRDWVPHSGWPFGIDELAPYYPKASKVVEIEPGRFDDKAYWDEATGQVTPELVTHRVQIRYTHFSKPTHFGNRYGDELKQADNLQVLLNANVINIASTEEGREVTQLDIRTLTGLTHQVRARFYVLATGGLENARMLLLSNRAIPAGLGNQHDLVGRFFMEHPHLPTSSEIVVGDLKRLPQIYSQRVYMDERAGKAAFNPSETYLRQRRLLNATIMVGEAGLYHTHTKAVGQKGQKHMEMLKAAKHFLTGGVEFTDPAQPDLLGRWLGGGCACEQVPNPDSRVSLAESKDALGLRKIRLDWRLTEQDRHSVVEHIRSVAMEFGALGIGRMWLNVLDNDQWPDKVMGGSHHMGTTRMHTDPRQGVVDPDCKVHGVSNLYVAGSSVFPTAGAANPTLTLVALTLRLADHLRPMLR
jgi:choline dehydrogenase-like flavoprotein